MHIFLDTATEDFLLMLFDENDYTIDKYYLKGYKKKVNLIADTFKTMLEKNKIQVQNINAFYINIGPGFFTGIRSSLVFVRTMALITKKPIFVTSTFDIMNLENVKKEDLTLDAQGGKIYYFNYQKYCETADLEKSVEVIEDDKPPMKLDHSKLISNWKSYKNQIFKEYKDVMLIEPMYIKNPQIGAKK